MMVTLARLSAPTCVESADLEELAFGSTRLSVPLLDDAIQLGIGGQYPIGVIEICKAAAVVTIRRVDGRPLQAHLVRDWLDPGRPGTRTAVLRHGVTVVTLDRIGAGRWAADAVPIRTIEDFAVFVNTAARFALAKQRRAGQRTA